LLSGSLCASFKEVEHSCQQCGAEVEDGRPFCPQCRAPQITVKIAAPDVVVTAGSNAAPDEVYPDILQAGHFGRPVAAPATMERGAAVRAAIKAGVLGLFIQVIPFLGIVLTGAVAVFFYRRENGLTLPSALGSRLGGAAGVVAFAINSLFITIRVFVFHGQQKYIDDMINVFQSLGINTANPDIQASIHNLFTPSGLALTFLFGMMVTVLLSSIGGALASAFLRRRNSHT
jgi:hypothetical protein